MKTLVSFSISLLLCSGCQYHYYTYSDTVVKLHLKEPLSKDVAFSCSLDDFALHTARFSDGEWVVSLPANKRFRYFYLLDGEVFVPPCTLKENDGFGSQNCIFEPNM